MKIILVKKLSYNDFKQLSEGINCEQLNLVNQKEV